MYINQTKSKIKLEQGLPKSVFSHLTYIYITTTLGNLSAECALLCQTPEETKVTQLHHTIGFLLPLPLVICRFSLLSSRFTGKYSVWIKAKLYSVQSGLQTARSLHFRRRMDYATVALLPPDFSWALCISETRTKKCFQLYKPHLKGTAFPILRFCN